MKIALTSLALDKVHELPKPKNEGISPNQTQQYSSKGRKEHAEEAYRQIFMKTLKNRKENIPL